MRRNGHAGKELAEKSILRLSAGSWSAPEQAEEVWIREQPKRQLRDEQVVDGALGGECCDDGDQVA